MTNSRSLLFSVLLTGTTVFAQSSWTSPLGMASVEGDAEHSVLFGSTYERFQQIDGDWAGTPRLGIQRLSLRQDGDETTLGGVARRVDLTVRIGRANLSQITDSFDANWVAPPTVIFAQRTIDLPDWSLAAAVRPAPFDFVVPFDTPYDHDGSAGLGIELQMLRPTVGTPPLVDRELGADHLPTMASGTAISTGCIASSQSFAMRHGFTLGSHGQSTVAPFGMRLSTELFRGPRNNAAILNLDLSDPQISLPGLCGTIHALPLVSLSLGNTDAFGGIAPQILDLPYTPSLEGVPLFSQVVALDPAAPAQVALSDGRRTVMPTAPRPSPNTAYLYTSRVTDTRAPRVWSGRAVVMELSR